MGTLKDLVSNIGPIGTNAIAQGIGGLIGLGTSALQHKYNKQLAEQQFAQNMTMWNKQNEYNSPTAQRKRLEEANLNPALMYGNGSVSTGNASQMPQYQQMGVDIGQNMMSALQMAQVVANIKNTNADTEGKKQENRYISPRNEALINQILQDTKTSRSQEVYNFKKVDLTMVQMSECQTRIDEILQDIEYKKVLTSHEGDKQKLTQLYQATEILRQVFVQAQTRNFDADTFQKNIVSNRYQQLLPYEIQESMSRANLNNANANDINAYGKYKRGLAQQQINKTNADWIYQTWYNNYWKTTGVRPDAGMAQTVQNILGSVATEVGNGIQGFFDWLF